jgi:hypothetical protein
MLKADLHKLHGAMNLDASPKSLESTSAGSWIFLVF